ncbi:hypothetical protein GCM10011409_31710 [Lentibacillus populi]|uniref:Uncharacterized protein n=1 Tax=Lentibacillus populi TaxID=1827502 RepID=A0A9W5TZL7_9BACI|nr:hypothetical protein GCM10011409_31710 [Lentibacillus populi]
MFAMNEKQLRKHLPTLMYHTIWGKFLKKGLLTYCIDARVNFLYFKAALVVGQPNFFILQSVNSLL